MFTVLRLAAAVVLLSALPALAAAPAAVSEAQLEEAVRGVLRKHPDIVLDVLRDNNELVLDITRQAYMQRRSNEMIAQWRQELDLLRPVSLLDRPVRGAADAPVTVVAFSDFTCPYCQRAEESIRAFLRDYEGKIRYIFKHYPLTEHKSAALAAEYYVAAAMQSPEKAWVLHDLLFQNSGALNDEGEPLIKRLAEEAGLDMKKLASARRSSASKINAVIDEDVADARMLGFQGTPNFLVNNLLVRGALTPELFTQAIDMAWEHAVRPR